MIQAVEDLSPASLAGFDAVIDVRTGAEFAVDHLPGALNLPVLDEAERALVGTIYTKESRFRARRIGAALIARNIARHLEEGLADRPPAWRPLIYCWRGGQRSGAMATILDQIGWRVAVVTGGYRTWRRRVQKALYDGELTRRMVLLDGDTGSGKTAILARLGERGVQTLDLEALAAHRGSLFGGLRDEPQPSQKLFESRLLARLEALDPETVTVVEAESSKIGERMIPPALWRAMSAARRIEVSAPLVARAAFVAREYGVTARDRSAVAEILARLPGRHGRKRIGEWLTRLDGGDVTGFAEALMEGHYDPAYRRGRPDGPPIARVPLDDPARPEAAVEAIMALLA